MNKLLKNWWWLANSFVMIPIFCDAQSFQNLVINGSFETYTQCPNSVSKISFAPPSIGPTTNSTPYFNSCSQNWNVPYYAGVGSAYPAYLLAKDGNAYTDLIIFRNYNNNSIRTYVQLKLAQPLSNNMCYFVEFYAANWQRVKYRCNNLSACFTTDTLPTHLLSPGTIPNIQPHITRYGNPILEDTVKWINISGIYDAIGNEEYLTIGNFKDNSNTDTVNIYPPGTGAYSYSDPSSFVFIDAVSIYSINPNGPLPWSYRDTIINKGDSVFIGNKMGGLNFHPQWFTQNGAYIKTNAGITVSPTVTTKYVVQYTLCGVQRTDTVKVSVPQLDTLDTDLSIEKLRLLSEGLKIYPVPADEILNFKLKIENGLASEAFKITIYNNLGQMVREEEITFKNGASQIKTDEFENGVYMLSLRSGNAGTVSKRFILNR